MKRFKLYLLVTSILVAIVIAGCGVVVDVPVTPSTGYIRICTNRSWIYGTLYVGNNSWGVIDGANVIGSSCLGGDVVLGRTYSVEVYDDIFGTGSYCCRNITPTYSGQTFYLP